MRTKISDIRYNLSVMEQLVREAADLHADAIVLPELCVTGYRADGEFSELSEPLDGDIVRKLTAISKNNSGIYIYTAIPERDMSGGKPFNSAVLVGADGLVGSYRKIHLWGAETQYFAAGKETRMIDTPFGRAGLMVCFDVSFPELARKHALAGADILLYTFAFANPAREYAFDLLTRTRALENGCYLAAANLIGVEKGTEFFGSSRIVDPAGNVLANAGKDEGVVCADVDFDVLEAIRKKYPYLERRMPDTY